MPDDIQSSQAAARNLSLNAEDQTPTVPNRGTRARLRSIRWLSPLEAQDLEEFHTIPGAGRPNLPSLPSLPTRASLHVTEKVWEDVSATLTRWVYKEPHVVLSVLTEQARQSLRGLAYGDYFSVFIVTRLNEKGLVTFELGRGEMKPVLSLSDIVHQEQEVSTSDYFLKLKLVEVAEKTALAAASGRGQFPPVIYVQDRAFEIMDAGRGGNAPHWVSQLILEKAVTEIITGVGEFGLGQKIYSILEKAMQEIILDGAFNPLLTASDRATSGMDLAGSGYRIKTVSQAVDDKAFAFVVDGVGTFSQTLLQQIILDKATMTEITGNGVYPITSPKADPLLWSWHQADLGATVEGVAPNETFTVGASWADQSGNNRPFTAPAAHAPFYLRSALNGKAIVQFKGNENFNQGAATGLLANCTIILLMRVVAWASGKIFLDGSSNYALAIGAPSGSFPLLTNPVWMWYGGVSAAFTTQLQPGAWHVVTVKSYTNFSQLKIDNNDEFITGATTAPVRMTLGSLSDSTSYATVDVAAVIATNSVDEFYITGHRNYLAAWGGLSLKLPMVTFSNQITAAPVMLSMWCTNYPQAKIYYTADGSTPTISSTLYGGRFNVASPATIKAIAVQAGFSNSDVATWPFSPSQLSSLIGWYKPEAIVGLNDGDMVASWPDSSGINNHAAQATDSLKPLYKTNISNGLAAVRFDGVDDALVTPINLTSTTVPPDNSFAIFVLYYYRNATLTGDHKIITGSTANWWIGTTGGYYGVCDGASVLSSTQVVTQNRVVRQTWRNHQRSSGLSRGWLRIDGSYHATSTVSIYPGILKLGATLNGDVVEVIVVNRRMTDAQCRQVEDYLRERGNVFFRNSATDDFESYTPGVLLGGLDGGSDGSNGDRWTGPYNATDAEVRNPAVDDFESYAVGAQLNGLNGGQDKSIVHWTGPYQEGAGYMDPTLSGFEDFESYSLGAIVAPLNSGSAWAAAWNIPTPSLGVLTREDFESYALGVVSSPLAAGSGWDGSWNIPLIGDILKVQNGYDFPYDVTLTGVAGASTYYTVDGSTPTTSSPAYTAPINMTTACTLKVLQVKAGYTSGLIAEFAIINFGMPAGLVAFWGADSFGLADGTAIGDTYPWIDQSGHANSLTQTVAVARPIFKMNVQNGLPVIRFSSASNQYLKMTDLLSFAESSALTVVAVAKTGSDSILLGHDLYNVQFRRYRIGANNISKYWNGGFDSTSDTFVGTGFGVWTWRRTGTAGAWWENLTPRGTFTSYEAFNLNRVGVTSYGGYFNGDICEILIFNTALSDADLTHVQTVLKAKYGL